MKYNTLSTEAAHSNTQKPRNQTNPPKYFTLKYLQQEEQ